MHSLLVFLGDGVLAASFVAGLFFTSVVTTAPAVIVLGELALEGNVFLVALFGAAGAVIGDYILFAFVRDRVSEDIAHIMNKGQRGKFRALMRRKTFKWLLPFLGGLIIASPLPDELGLTLLGMTRMKTSRFVPLSYLFNFIGILLIGLATQALVS